MSQDVNEESVEIAETNGSSPRQQSAPSPSLFGTDDPGKVVEKATTVANELKDVLDNQDLIADIGGQDHVEVEGWTLLGTMLGLSPETKWTKDVTREGRKGVKAKVDVINRNGEVISSAEAMCMDQEYQYSYNQDAYVHRWVTRCPGHEDEPAGTECPSTVLDYAVESMAQTRATSKALRQPLGFVMTLAGFSATPKEEMDGVDTSSSSSNSNSSDYDHDPDAYPPSGKHSQDGDEPKKWKDIPSGYLEHCEGADYGRLTEGSRAELQRRNGEEHGSIVPEDEQNDETTNDEGDTGSGGDDLDLTDAMNEILSDCSDLIDNTSASIPEIRQTLEELGVTRNNLDTVIEHLNEVEAGNAPYDTEDGVIQLE